MLISLIIKVQVSSWPPGTLHEMAPNFRKLSQPLKLRQSVLQNATQWISNCSVLFCPSRWLWSSVTHMSGGHEIWHRKAVLPQKCRATDAKLTLTQKADFRHPSICLLISRRASVQTELMKGGWGENTCASNVLQIRVSTLHAPHQQELEILQAILSIFYTWNFGALNEVLGLIEVDIWICLFLFQLDALHWETPAWPGKAN